MKCQLKLRVSAGARRDALLGWRGEAIKVSVSAAPEKGKANKVVIKLLATALDVRPASITIKHGQSSPDKSLEIDGISTEQAIHRLQTLIGLPPSA